MLWSKVIGAKDSTGPQGWNVSTATFVQSFPVGAQETTPTSVFFRPDGKKMYVLGFAGDDVNEYDLTIEWNVSTATYLRTFGVALQETNPLAVSFGLEGLKMYVMGSSGVDVNEYDLTIAWNVSTASYLQKFSVAGQETSPAGIFFKPDGLKMYVVGFSGDDVNEYDLYPAWNVTTASYLRTFSVALQENNPRDVFFRSDGKKMYIVGVGGVEVNEYNLTEGWNVSTASYLQTFSVSGKETAPNGLFFKPDGLKMYVIGLNSDSVHEYDLTA